MCLTYEGEKNMNFHGGNIYQFDKEILDYSSNINPLGVPQSFKRMLYENINAFTRYPDIDYKELREIIAKYIGVHAKEHVVVGNGAVEIIYKAVVSLDIKEVIIASPTFSEYRSAVANKGIPVNEINVYDEITGELLVEKLLDHIKPNSLLIICNPNNPTGSITDIKTLCTIAKELDKVNSYLLLDEAFIEFTSNYPNSSMVSKLKDNQNVFVVRAATKFFGMPGIRLGYGVTFNKELMTKIKHRLEPWNVNTAAVIAGLTIFNDKEYINKSREWIRSEKEFVYNELKFIEGLYVYPSDVNFFLIKITKEDMDAEKLKELMIEHGVLIRTPDGFTHLTKKHVRVAVKDRESNVKMIKALKRCIRIK